ncbi:MAG: pyridoxamine 5'-phosphate oxidase [Acidobacteriota bacterium]|nr:MAG: pyridoxamine 5'-phosphate oxidase [Acidobacteriota bacterium]
MTWRRLRGLLLSGRAVVQGLSEESCGDDPLVLFDRWFRDARRSEWLLPEAMTLATATADGVPAARMMLLKHADQHGFVFYTNYDSRKGQELVDNPRAALVFHWKVLQRQVRVEGSVTRLRHDESYAYFRTRPRGSRIGAWASPQSAVMASRDELERSFAEHESRFAAADVPLPPFWGGMRLLPVRIEFWQGRLNRLHDRIAFTRKGDGWGRQRLAP